MLWGMRPHGTPQQLEARRRRAVALLRAGKTYQSVAATLTSSISSVVRWAQSFRHGGAVALQPKPTPGRPPRFSQSQERKLLRLLERGACAAGYTTDLWTLQRIAKLIDKHFDLRPGAIIRDLGLRAPIYKQTAAYGHFGRDDLNLPWERTDKAAVLRREGFVGVQQPATDADSRAS